MPKVKITGLPKMQTAGQCPEGMTYVQGKGCIPTRFAGVGTPSTSTVPGTVTPAQQGQVVSDGCQAGFARNQRGECVPAYTIGIDPSLANTGSIMGPFPDDIGGSGATAASTTTTNTASSNQKPTWTKKVQQANAALMGLLNVGSGLTRLKENARIKREFEKAFREANFSGPVQPGRNLGNVETNTGVQFPNMLSPVNEGMFITQFGGNLMGQNNMGKLKIRIEAAPEQMKYGGQSGYGLDLGWRKFYTDMSKTDSDHYTNTMSEDKSADEPPVIEAEGGETFIRPEADGSASFFEIRGDRHYKGGVELTEPQIASKLPNIPSFMFSDTPKLKIKNPEILKMFGVSESEWKKGVTPAKISKKFSLNEWNAIIKDPNKDSLAKSTAQMMIDKNTGMLAKLAAVQESMKGEQLPVFAQQRLAQGKAEYGGKIGLPKYQAAGSMDWTKDFDQVKSLLTSPEFADLRKALYDRYKADRGKDDKITEDEYISSLLEGQRQKYVINEKLATDPRLKSPNWDLGANKGFGRNVYYKQVAKELGLTPQSEKDILRSQQAFLDMYDLLSSEPEFIKKYGNVFALERRGVADEPEYKGQKNITKADEWRGNTDIGQIIKLAKAPTTPKPPDIIPPPPGKKPVPPGQEMRYVCVPDPNNKGRFIAKGVMVTEGAGGFTTPQEAEAFCNRGSKGTPFGYTAPDLYNMTASSAVFPRLIMPFVPTAQLETPPLALEDWRARTANRFATMYAAPAQTLGTYGPAQGLASNLSKLSGEAAQAQAAQDMAPVIGSNIGRANQWFSQTAAIRNAQRQAEAQAQKERWLGRAVALQQYDNAIRGYLKDFGKAFDRGWNNRQKLGDINDTNIHFYKDPFAGRQVFKPSTAGFAGLGAGYSTGAGSASLGANYAERYAKYLNDLQNVTLNPKSKKSKEDIASELAMMDIRASRTTQRTDKYGNPLGGTSSGFDLDNEDATP